MPEREGNWETPTNRAAGADSAINAIDPATATGPDWVRLARESYEASTTFLQGDVRRDWEDNIRMFHSRHPEQSKYLSDAYKHRSKIFRPKTRAAVRKDEAATAAAFFSTADIMSVQAEDETNPLQAANAVLMREILNYRLTRTIPWFLTCMGARQDANVIGICVSRQDWLYEERQIGTQLTAVVDPTSGALVIDPETGAPMMQEQPVMDITDEPRITLIPPENIRHDPGADWRDPVNSSPYFIEMMPMYFVDVKAHMTRVDQKTGEPPWIEHPDATILQARGEDYNEVRQAREENRRDSKESDKSVRDHETIWVHANFIRTDDGEDWYYLTLGTQALLTEPIPAREAYPHEPRPYVIGYSVIEAHRTWPSSKVRLGQPLQREINEVTNQRLDNVHFSMDGRYFARRGRRVDLKSLRRRVSGSITLMDDPEKDVIWHRPADVTRSSYEEQDRLSVEFDDVFGGFSPSSVQTNRKLNETVGGMQLLNSNANSIADYDLRVFSETWVEPVLRQMVKLEQMYETDEVVLAIAGSKANLWQEFGIPVTEELLHNEVVLAVNVGTGAGDPNARVMRLAVGIKTVAEYLASPAAQIGNTEEIINEIFGALGYKDGSRFFALADDPKVQQLLQYIDQLEAVIEQKQIEAGGKLQIEKLKGTFQQRDRRSQNAAMLAGKIMDREQAMEIEQMRQAGEVGRTIADMIEGGRNREAAERQAAIRAKPNGAGA